MSAQEHEPIWSLLDEHDKIKREVRELSNGVETTTTTSSADLVDVLRKHVRQMAGRLEQDRPVRLWDPVFRDVFEHASAIEIEVTDVPNGVLVRETTADSEVVPMIQAHARAVNQFVAKGHAAARPPWAGPRW
jgi:hypothetical protein